MPQNSPFFESPGAFDEALVRYTLDIRREAEEARRERMRLNEINRAAYHNRQDWSHKIEGQSREFLPKTSVTVEQFTAFIKRGLVQFGSWFKVEVGDLDANALTEWLENEFDTLPTPDGDVEPIETRIAAGVKTGLLEAPLVFKVHGTERERDAWRLGEEGEPERSSESEWRLEVDLLKPENVLLDPWKRGLYWIHEDEYDFHDVVALSEGDDPVYDPEVVAKLEGGFVRVEREHVARREDSGQREGESPKGRQPVKLTEVWGTVLQEGGEVAEGPVRGSRKHQPLRRVLWTIANDKHVIRRPEPWPFWHGSHPFIELTMIDVPFSSFNKALYDQVVPLNHALNELYNLILDGGLASVWGIKELKTQYLEDPSQVTNGIPQGATLLLNENTPPGEGALNQVRGGVVPPDALNTYNLTDREFEVAALTSDMKQGLLPPKDVKATVAAIANEAQGVMLDSIVGDLERGIGALIRKALLTLAQNMDEASLVRLARNMPNRTALDLLQMTQAERFVTFTRSTTKVFGISATLQRARDFQRLLAILQLTSQNPLLMRAFLKQYSSDKLLQKAFKLLNLNPTDFERDPDEVAQFPDEIQDVMQLFGLTQSPRAGSAQGTFSSPSGEAGLQSDINQGAQPTEV